MNSKLEKVTARAHTNIALVKYWGKVDEQLIIPQTNSISLTLDHFYTDTSVEFLPSLEHDEIRLNNNEMQSKRVVDFMNLIRQRAQINHFAKIESINHVPTSAGLASSASAFAALAAAASRAAGMNLSNTDLSKLARRGSGSACRSIFGNFVEWHRGDNDFNSYASPIKIGSDMDIAMIAVVLKTTAKSISSRTGMELSVQTSPYYEAWRQVCNQDIQSIKQAIEEHDFTSLGKIAETNAMRMHALTMSADPDFLYLNGESIAVMDTVKNLRKAGIECYYTMDAGPNVKIICQSQNQSIIKQTLTQQFEERDIIVAHPGPGIQYI